MTELFLLRGRFVGTGRNHENQNFTGVFDIQPVAGNNGAAFSFLAIGHDGAAYHLESSLISRNLQGTPVLYVVSSNHPGSFERILKRKDRTDGKSLYVFTHGDTEEKSKYREEITIELTQKSVRYVYSWGLPGGEFKERSGCTMKLIE